MPSRRRALLLLGSAFAGAIGSAAKAEPEREQAIVVTGRGLPPTPGGPAYDSQEIDRERLRTLGSGRIEEALSSIAGFQQFRRSDSRSANPSAQGVTLRALGGNATSRALVLLDGVPMIDPFFGYVPLSALTPERLESVRVTRGGGSGPFGAGALAGTIELESADTAALSSVSGSALANDRGETELSGTLAGLLGDGAAALSGRWDRGRGFWTTPEAQRVPANVRARYESWSAQLRAVAPVAPDVTLQARLLAYRDARTLRFRGAATTMDGQDASLRLTGRGAWAFDAIAYVQARDFTNVVVSSTRFTPTLDQHSTPATGIGGKLELRPPVGRGHVLRIGADYRRAAGRLAEEALNAASGEVTERRAAGGVNTDLGLFVEDDFTLGRLTLTMGARADRVTIQDGFFETRSAAGVVTGTSHFPDRSEWTGSFRGGAVLALGEVSLRAAAYTGLRLPTLNELYRPFVIFPVRTEANPALANERLRGFEAGIAWQPVPRTKLAVTAFDNRVKGAIANVTVGPNLRQRQNIEAIRARGIEASARVTLGAFRIDGALAHTDARTRGSGPAIALDGKRPAQTPRWAASASLAWRPASGTTIAATVRHVGAQFEDDLERDLLPKATTLDGYTEFALAGGLVLVVRGENLTDERTITRNQAGSIDLGVPRTLWAGIRLGV